MTLNPNKQKTKKCNFNQKKYIINGAFFILLIAEESIKVLLDILDIQKELKFMKKYLLKLDNCH